MATAVGLREASFVDQDGRKWATQLPARASDTDAVLGIPLGPPDLSTLSLPLELEVRLHNELFGRRLWSNSDVSKRPDELKAALQAALQVDIFRIMELYSGGK